MKEMPETVVVTFMYRPSTVNPVLDKVLGMLRRTVAETCSIGNKPSQDGFIEPKDVTVVALSEADEPGNHFAYDLIILIRVHGFAQRNDKLKDFRAGNTPVQKELAELLPAGVEAMVWPDLVYGQPSVVRGRNTVA